MVSRIDLLKKSAPSTAMRPTLVDNQWETSEPRFRDYLLRPWNYFICLFFGLRGSAGYSLDDDATRDSYERMLGIQERHFGPVDQRLVSTLQTLAKIHFRQERWNEARDLYERALTIREQILGWRHPSLVTRLRELARICYLQGDFQKAATYYLREVAIREHEPGCDDMALVSLLDKAATNFELKWKDAESEVLRARELSILSRALGPNHPLVKQKSGKSTTALSDEISHN